METQDFVFSASAIGDDNSDKEPPNGDGGWKIRVSFKNMMMGNKEVIPPRPKVDLLKEN